MNEEFSIGRNRRNPGGNEVLPVASGEADRNVASHGIKHCQIERFEPVRHTRAGSVNVIAPAAGYYLRSQIDRRLESQSRIIHLYADEIDAGRGGKEVRALARAVSVQIDLVIDRVRSCDGEEIVSLLLEVGVIVEAGIGHRYSHILTSEATSMHGRGMHNLRHVDGYTQAELVGPLWRNGSLSGSEHDRLMLYVGSLDQLIET